jgi:hypothetical protein
MTDHESMALVLADALVLGDKSAARKWSISIRSVQRYRAIARATPALAALVAEKNAEVSHDLATLRVAFLRDALEALREKLPTGSLYEVAGAIKIVGELHQTAMMVDDELACHLICPVPSGL